NPPGAAQRDAHPKQHGTVYGQFTVEKDLDERLRKGLFAEAASYDALVRFSNQNNIPQHDYVKDVRGMAVKVCGVQGNMTWHYGKPATSQDFLAITHDVFTTRNVDDFDALIKAVLRSDDGRLIGLIAKLLMVLSRFPARLYIWKNYRQAFRRHPNPLHLTYFSTVPYLHGAGQAMKFRFRPSLAEHREAGRLKPQKGQPSNFLQLGMKRVLQKVEHYDFDMEVQLRDAKHNMPIENPATRWRERDAPFVKVATLTIPSQVFDSPAQLEYGDNLAFSPWHCLKAHRPLGGINRARRVIMREVLSLRRAMNRVRQPEPVSTHEFRSLEPKSGTDFGVS
ncbi:MAG: catalase, partial [Woeseia sp.]|nr:catalase [Woeseia sp.]